MKGTIKEVQLGLGAILLLLVLLLSRNAQIHDDPEIPCPYQAPFEFLCGRGP